MKFKIVRSKFIEELKRVQNIVVGKGSLPILQNVLIEAKGKEIFLLTTDLDISIKTNVECEVIEEGKSTLPVKLLFNSMMKAAEGVVEVDIDKNDVAVIKAGSMRLKLNGKSAEEFPTISNEEEKVKLNMPRQTLIEMMRKTQYAASQDDTRRTLKGLMMSFSDNKITMVATDGRRLAMVENEIEYSKANECEIVLPAKTVQEVLRSSSDEKDVKICMYEGKICFDMGSLKIFSKLIDEKYPNYRQVIPSECSEKIVVDRQLLFNAIERASVMTIEEAHSIKLNFSLNVLTVSSAASDVGEAKDEVPIKYAGNDIEIIFNPQYVMDPLKVIDDDEITININNGHSPVVISCSIPFLYVLMPLRVN